MIRSLPVTASTNDDVLAAAAAGELEGLWVRADRQTAGRGRQGRTWASPAGNLHASALVRLRPADPPAPTLGFVAGVALHEALQGYAPAAALRLKWPNDLFAGRAKLAGILLERAGDAVAVGIGANLARHPESLDHPATDLCALTGAVVAPAAFLDRLAPAFARWLAACRGEGLPALLAAWEARAFPAGTPLRAREGEAVVHGAFERLAPDGALLLRLPGGGLRAIHAGDVFPV